MPNGFPYFLYASEDFCTRCDKPLCEHRRERVCEDGMWHYRYFCPDGNRCGLPQRREAVTDGGTNGGGR